MRSFQALWQYKHTTNCNGTEKDSREAASSKSKGVVRRSLLVSGTAINTGEEKRLTA